MSFEFWEQLFLFFKKNKTAVIGYSKNEGRALWLKIIIIAIPIETAVIRTFGRKVRWGYQAEIVLLLI